jgi:calcium-binding protein CML
MTEQTMNFADMMERPDSAPSLTEQNGLGEDSMTGFIRHCMDSILQPIDKKTEELTSSLTSVRADLTKTSIKTDLNTTAAREQFELLTGLRVDLSETASQANATQKSLEVVKAEKAALEVEYQATKATLADANGRLAVAEGAIADVQREVRDSLSKIAKQKEAQASAERDLAQEIRPALERLTSELATLTSSHKEAAAQIERVVSENTPEQIRNIVRVQREQRDSAHANFDRIESGLDLLNEKIVEAHTKIKTHDEHNKVQEEAVQLLRTRIDGCEVQAVAFQHEQAALSIRIGDHDERHTEVDKALHDLREFRKTVEAELQARSVILGNHGKQLDRHAEKIELLQKASGEHDNKLIQDAAKIAQTNEEHGHSQARINRLEKSVGLPPYVKPATTRSAPSNSQVDLEELKKVFAQIDKDGSGTIDITELGMAMRSMGHDLDPQTLQDMMSQVDSDGDGTIGFEEFCDMVKKTLGAGSAEDGVKKAFENMSLIARQKAAFDTIEEHTVQIRSHVAAIQHLKESALDHRLDTAEDNIKTVRGEVSRLKQGLELTQEYWKGLSNGLKQTKPSASDKGKMSSTWAGPMSARGECDVTTPPFRKTLPAIVHPAGRPSSRECVLSPGMSDASTVCSPKDHRRIHLS